MGKGERGGRGCDTSNSNTFQRSAWPGQQVSVSLVGFDEFDHHTATSTSFLFQPNQFSNKVRLLFWITTTNNMPPQNLSATSLRLEPQIVVLTDYQDNDGLLTNSFPFSYSVNSPDILTSPDDEPVGWVVAEEAFISHPVNSLKLTSFITYGPLLIWPPLGLLKVG